MTKFTDPDMKLQSNPLRLELEHALLITLLISIINKSYLPTISFFVIIHHFTYPLLFLVADYKGGI